MTPQRGDVLLVRYPFSSGVGAKVRPALVVQNDQNNRRLSNIIMVAITTTTHRSGQPTQLLIEAASPIGRQAGLLRDSVVTCENLATIDKGLILRNIGSLPAIVMDEINDCLKAALGFP
jgi:mRNA interferase MazF